MSRLKKLYQTEYRLIGTSRIAKNIELQNAYPVMVTAKRVTFCTIAHLPPIYIDTHRRSIFKSEGRKNKITESPVV